MCDILEKKKQFSESSSTHSTAGCPTIISRSEWGARAPTHHNGRLPTTPGHVYIHHGATPGCHTKADCIQRVQSYQNYHMDSHGMKDIKLSNKKHILKYKENYKPKNMCL